MKPAVISHSQKLPLNQAISKMFVLNNTFLDDCTKTLYYTTLCNIMKLKLKHYNINIIRGETVLHYYIQTSFKDQTEIDQKVFIIRVFKQRIN